MKRSPNQISDEDGVTHYRLDFRKAPPEKAALVDSINRWRTVFHKIGWIGQDPRRYRGVGFGNVSRRLPGTAFVVSGTQTGRKTTLTNREYARVLSCRPKDNRVTASGPVPPSSESMTHAMIYELDATAQVVIHVHAPLLWRNAHALKIPATSPRALYGTPEMTTEVKRLYKNGELRTKKILSMGGHLDGIISFGRTAGEAGSRLLRYGLMAYAIETFQ